MRVSFFEKCKEMLSTFILLILLSFYATPIFAQSDQQQTPLYETITAQSMVQTVSQQVPSLMRAVTAFAYVAGMALIVFSILKLKQYGESRTMMSHERQLLPAMALMITGALLLYLPSSVQIGLSTFWSTPNPYGYLQLQDQWNQFLSACYLIIQLIGTIALIRGLLILSKIGSHAQGATVGKGLLHVIGGILCINIYQFVQVVLNTLGIQT